MKTKKIPDQLIRTPNGLKRWSFLKRAMENHDNLIEELERMTAFAAQLLSQGEGIPYNPEGNGYIQSARAVIAQARAS